MQKKGGSTAVEPPPPPPPPPDGADKFTGKTLIGTGDSIMNYAAGNADGYMMLIAANKGASGVLNRGNGGASLCNPTDDPAGPNGNYFHPGYEPANLYKLPGTDPYFHQTQIDEKSSGNFGYNFIAWGANDLRHDPAYYTKAQFKATYIHVLDYYVSNYGWSYSDIVLCSATYQTPGPSSLQHQIDFRDAVQEVAALKHTIFHDVFQAMLDSPNPDSLLVDGLHLSTSGNAFVADFHINASYTPL